MGVPRPFSSAEKTEKRSAKADEPRASKKEKEISLPLTELNTSLLKLRSQREYLYFP